MRNVIIPAVQYYQHGFPNTAFPSVATMGDLFSQSFSTSKNSLSGFYCYFLIEGFSFSGGYNIVLTLSAVAKIFLFFKIYLLFLELSLHDAHEVLGIITMIF